MAIRICVLGSGSGGNCTLYETEDYRLLIDAARLPQKYIKHQLENLGTSINEINGIFATHIHGDHVDKNTLGLSRRYDIPIMIHSGSRDDLMRRDARFKELERVGLIRYFDSGTVELRENLKIRAFNVNHGSGGWNRDIVGRPVGFRITYSNGGSDTCVAHTTDLGEATPEVLKSIADVEALVIESNHDVAMEKNSRRPPFLVKWVLGSRGHLSNDQAAEAIAHCVSHGQGLLKHVFLAHLSEDCNAPRLALDTAQHTLDTLDASGTSLHLTAQRTPSEEIIL